MSDHLRTSRARLNVAVAMSTILALALSIVAVSAPPASAANYTLSGAVTLPSGYTPAQLGSTSVWLTNTATKESKSGSYNPATGRWSATNVPAGSYTLRIVPSDSSPLSWEYYGNKIRPEDATVVTVAGNMSNLDFALELKIPDAAVDPDIFKGDKTAGFLFVGDTIRAVAPVFSGFTYSSVTFRWYLDSVYTPRISGTQYTLTPAEFDQRIGIGAVISKPGYTPREFKYTNIFKIDGGKFTAPAEVVINGTRRVGETLTAVPGTWSPTPSSISYQWKRGSVDIAGATKSTYKLTPADRGHLVRVSVTAKLYGYADKTLTSEGQTVMLGLYTSAPSPTFPQAPRVGTPLKATVGTWLPKPDTITYQWTREGEYIKGATKTTYTPTAADLGLRIEFRVYVDKDGYGSTWRTTGGTTVLPGLFKVSKAPSISGELKPGATLTANPGTWSPAPKFTYQWLRDGEPIAGATKAKYKLPSNARGSKFTVRVTATKTAYETTTRTKSVSVLHLFKKTPKPTISGSAYKGAKLTAKTGTWSPAPDSFSYQWYRNGKAISGAKSATYKLVAADSGKTITVKVTGKKAGYKSVAKTSAKKVLKKFFTKSPAPKISGTGKVGKTLTAKVGTWSPKPSKFTYQWYRDGKAISKATKSTYKLKAADAGKKITVKVTAKRSGYASTPKTSAAKSVALQTFAKAPAPKISGDPSVGATLTATTGTWSPKPTFTYQWYRAGVAIPGATASTYVLVGADAGAAITVKVTGSKTGYKTKTVTSTAVTVV